MTAVGGPAARICKHQLHVSTGKAQGKPGLQAQAPPMRAAQWSTFSSCQDWQVCFLTAIPVVFYFGFSRIFPISSAATGGFCDDQSIQYIRQPLQQLRSLF